MYVFSFLGGINDQMNQLIRMCKEKDILIVYSMNRKKLGSAISSRTPISAIAIR
eukprot:Awhi_evm1s13791